MIDATGPTNFRKDYRLLRQGGKLVMYGLAEASVGTGRDMRKLIGSLARMPFATLPWWKSLQVMNENKGVFGLNMLHWWDREGDVRRITGPLVQELDEGNLEPVVAESFPFEQSRRRRTDSSPSGGTSGRSCWFPELRGRSRSKRRLPGLWNSNEASSHSSVDGPRGSGGHRGGIRGRWGAPLRDGERRHGAGPRSDQLRIDERPHPQRLPGCRQPDQRVRGAQRTAHHHRAGGAGGSRRQRLGMRAGQRQDR